MIYLDPATAISGFYKHRGVPGTFWGECSGQRVPGGMFRGAFRVRQSPAICKLLNYMGLDQDTSFRDVSDEQLVERYRRDGDEAMFAELVERYRQEMFHFLLRFMGRKSLADEVFQEVFLQIHLSADTFDTTRRFKPWLFTIAANKARDCLRRNNRRQTVSMSALSSDREESTAGGVLDLMEAPSLRPDDDADRNEVAAMVRQVVDDLPEHWREVLVLAYFQRLAYKEIAEMLGIPLGTVKSRLHASVACFAQQWIKRNGENDPS